MFSGIKNLFRARRFAPFQRQLQKINELSSVVASYSDDQLQSEARVLREEVLHATHGGFDLPESLRIRAFALAREAAQRTLHQRPYDVQMIGGLVIAHGAIAEMGTGEGKTLTAVSAAYANALTGRGVHVVTVNEYLARRDAVWMGQIYRMLGLSVACLVPHAAYIYDPEWKIPVDSSSLIDAQRDATGNFLVQQDFLRPVSRREAYAADITYGTNHEFGFDYLRDHLAYSLTDQVQRGHAFAIIDEVDSILIDEARTPLIISAPDSQSSDFYKTFARIARTLVADVDYEVDEKFKSVRISESGISKVERSIGVSNLYAPENIRLVHYAEESLKAHALFHKDKDYVVKNGEIIIVDEFTGRLLQGRRYNGGLHQAIEAKEGVFVKEESRTYAKISIQNYFRLYKKISGMTGTASTSAEEFHKVYGLEVYTIASHVPSQRRDLPDRIYKNQHAKMRAIVAEVRDRHMRGQPVLVGTASIAANEVISQHLHEAGVAHEVLNAKNNEREGAIIAQAGRRGAVMVATNVAGRGVDIILGGNPPIAEEAKFVREVGGLHVIGTQRHEARRIDNQLRGRSGRQGDPGSSQFYLALDDDLMRIFGGDRIKNLMERFHLPDDEAIEMPIISRAVAEAQSKVEGAHFDSRKHLLEYDDVLNKQRSAVYKKRQEILTAFDRATLSGFIADAALLHAKQLILREQQSISSPQSSDETVLSVREQLITARVFPSSFSDDLDDDALNTHIRAASDQATQDPATIGRLLSLLDMLWMNHLDDLEALSESVGLRAYGQRDPLVEYRREANVLYRQMNDRFNEWICMNLFVVSSAETEPRPSVVSGSALAPALKPAIIADTAKFSPVGRNDPCPCGSGKKYKKCHGK